LSDSIPDLPFLLSPEPEPEVEDREELFTETFWRKTYRRAYAMVRHHQDAEDLAQEACLKLWKETTLGRSFEVVSAWIFVVMRNAMVGQFRKNRPDLRVPLIKLAPHTRDEQEMDGAVDIPDTAAPTSLDRLIAMEQLDEDARLAESVVAALQGLSEIERNCVVMVAYGFSMPQIAKTLKLDYSSARRITRQATEKIRSKIGMRTR
jgi:RNA polymerase sigma factor (sigma-70 family)